MGAPVKYAAVRRSTRARLSAYRPRDWDSGIVMSLCVGSADPVFDQRGVS